jgi:hypothetical protein
VYLEANQIWPLEGVYSAPPQFALRAKIFTSTEKFFTKVSSFQKFSGVKYQYNSSTIVS